MDNAVGLSLGLYKFASDRSDASKHSNMRRRVARVTISLAAFLNPVPKLKIVYTFLQIVILMPNTVRAAEPQATRAPSHQSPKPPEPQASRASSHHSS